MNSKSFYKAVFIIAILLSLFLLGSKSTQPASTSSQGSRSESSLSHSPSTTHQARSELQPPISCEQAARIAVNRFTEIDAGIDLQHPRHQVAFRPDGLSFQSQRGPIWKWSAKSLPSTAPILTDQTTVTYQRENFTEHYLAKVDAIEQRFVLSENPNTDVTIEGDISCDGTFEEHPHGWLWRGRGKDKRVVSLGGVTVFDAAGKILPAEMEVTASTTRIAVLKEDLAGASYPVTIDPEIGTNDFRISASGDNYVARFRADQPAATFNPRQKEYFIVWRADGTAGQQKREEYEIIGQRINAETGAFLGERQIVISTTFEDGIASFVAPNNPDVIYNPSADEYLVAWKSNTHTIHAQRLNGLDASLVGSVFQLNEAEDRRPSFPKISWSPEWSRYFIVWSGYRTDGGFATNENEILGRFFSTLGRPLTGTIRISDMGPDGDADYDAANSAVAYDIKQEQFLVVWAGDDDTGSLVNDELEVFGQLINAKDGAEVGPNDIRLSDMGTDGTGVGDSFLPAVASDWTNGQFLVVWEGRDETSERNVYGQAVNSANGAELGPNDFQIDDPSNDQSSNGARVIFNEDTKSFLVVWQTWMNFDPESSSLEREVFGKIILAKDLSLLGEDTRLSDLGPAGDSSYGAIQSNVFTSGPGKSFFVGFPGTDNRFGLIKNEREIFGQLAVIDGNVILEQGPNDIRISEAGFDGDNISDTFFPAVAWNATDQNHLVVWESDAAKNNSGIVEIIMGNRIDGTSGARLHETDFEISGNTGGSSGSKENSNPAATWNGIDNQFLVAWSGNKRNDNGHSSSEYEIFIRRLRGDTGQLLDEESRISSIGTLGSPQFSAENPSVADNILNNQYLVVWQADNDEGALINGEFEIYGQRLNGTDGSEVGTDDFRISTTGIDGDAGRDAINPVVTFNGFDYLVAWESDGGTIDDKYEISYNKVAGGTGVLAGQAQLSQSGDASNADLGAFNPAIASSLDGRTLITWQADREADGEFQIHGRLLTHNIIAPGDRLEISSDFGAIATNPACAYHPGRAEFAVVWQSQPGGEGDGSEIRSQFLNPADGSQTGADDFFLSDMGPAGDENFNAETPAIAINTDTNTYLALWNGDNDENGHIDEEFEVYGQFFESQSGVEITEVLQVGNNNIIRFRGVENVIYQLQKSSTLQFTTTQPGEVLATGGIDQFTDLNGASSSHQFYRVIKK